MTPDAARLALRVLVCPDSFKGTFTAAEATALLSVGLADGGAWPVACPLADGGEGTLTVLAAATVAHLREIDTVDALGRPITADIAVDAAAGTAVVEAATAIGLPLIDSAERDPELASSAGVGVLIAAAVAAGAREIVVTVGGVATTDGGLGAIEALHDAGGLGGARLTVLCDVTTRFEQAAQVFGPQKGADADTVERLTDRLHRLAATLARDPRGVPMTGAAGGLAGGLWAAFDAQLVAGANRVLDLLGVDTHLHDVVAAVTGEGSLDPQSFDGKVIGALTARAAAAGVPVHAVAGSVDLAPGEFARTGLATVRQAATSAGLIAAGRAIAADLARR